MLIDYFDRMFMRGCVPYTSVDGIKEEDNGLGTIVLNKKEIKTSMEYSNLRDVYEKAIMDDEGIDIFSDIDDEEDV